MPNQKPSSIGQDRAGYAMAYNLRFSSHSNYMWVSWGPACSCLLTLGTKDLWKVSHLLLSTLAQQ